MRGMLAVACVLKDQGQLVSSKRAKKGSTFSTLVTCTCMTTDITVKGESSR